jgi:hypothetical protein
MYWMLLPLDPNAERHLESPSSAVRDYWIEAWRAGIAAVRHLLNVKLG